jgi:hypothetical protein
MESAEQTRCPYKKEVKSQKDYRFQKGGFAIIAIAGCDVDGRFISAQADHSGSTNDIIAWHNSKLCKWLEVEGGLPPKYFFIGDEAFTNTMQFLSPWPGRLLTFRFFFGLKFVSNYVLHLLFPFQGRGLDRYKDSFNYWLSHSRQAVERAFGMLTQCWGIFW